MARGITRENHISFRVSDEELKQIGVKAEALGITIRQWCRRTVLEQLSRKLPPFDRLLYEEVAKVHYLVGHGFRLMAADQLTTATWEGVQKAGAENWDKIADHLLQKQMEKNGGKS